ncbi:hypothetical protein LCGC14_0568270 [marine sediment metagenome]|uniref:Uncharacterized protein n=1 Tax=marine sediment metagenome TaxID=412755 RepID=A0A0F9RJY1_9ZZZZ
MPKDRIRIVKARAKKVLLSEKTIKSEKKMKKPR